MALEFRAFIDDSKSRDEFVLAGHIAPAEAWANFTKEWEELLPVFGTKAKNGNYHFKMAEMAQSKERMARVPLFNAVIEKYVSMSICCRINLEDFENAKIRAKQLSLVLPVNPNLGPFENPYFTLFRGLIDRFHADRHLYNPILPEGEKVEFFFDNQTEKQIIKREWDAYMDKREDEIRQLYAGEPRFEDDQEFLPLQAADFWAWWTREWYEEDNSEYPDKMRNFDFGTWKGKSRPTCRITMNEDQILDNFQALLVENAADSFFDTP